MWVDQATISATAPLTSGRLCYTDGRDVACDAAAPLITTSGTIYGKFTGDGSGLTGVTAGSSDRIVSGTTSILASQNTSLTFVTSGSTAMTIGANGWVGVGTNDPSTPLYVQTTGMDMSNALTLNNFYNQAITLGWGSGSTAVMGVNGQYSYSFTGYGRFNGVDYKPYMALSSSAGLGWNTGTSFSETTDIGLARYAANVLEVNRGLTLANGGSLGNIIAGTVGIGTQSPSTALEVSGTVSATGIQVAQSAITCNGAAVGTLRRNPTTNKLQICLDH